MCFDIEKFNSMYNQGFVETDFGYYTLDEENPGYYDGNCIVLERVTKKFFEVLRDNKTFRKIVAPKGFLEKYCFNDVDRLTMMRYVGSNKVSQNYKGYTVDELKAEDRDEYTRHTLNSQRLQYGEEYRKINFEKLRDDYQIYVIKYDGKIVGSFDVFGSKSIENVWIDEEHRRKDVMKNSLQYVAKTKELYLSCGSDVVSFYEKCDFEIVESFESYSVLLNSDIVSKILSDCDFLIKNACII